MNEADEPIKFPVWPDVPVPPKQMTMTEYTAFVEFCWQNLPDKEKRRLREERLHDGPTVPFVIP